MQTISSEIETTHETTIENYLNSHGWIVWRVTGISMLPLLRENRDTVTIEKIKSFYGKSEETEENKKLQQNKVALECENQHLDDASSRAHQESENWNLDDASSRRNNSCHNNTLHIGDVILFKREDGNYVLHRIVKINVNSYITRGDNCKENDSPIEKGKVIGKMVAYTRNGKKYTVDSKRNILYLRHLEQIRSIRFAYACLKIKFKHNTKRIRNTE